MYVDWTRAEITVPEDLAAALKAGVIGSAALNWATSAPLPKDSPLWSAPNLILAPWAGTGAGAVTGTGTGTGPASSARPARQIAMAAMRRARLAGWWFGRT